MIGTCDDDSDGARTFERSRRTLQGLAYRILGSRSDAEDAVQDTFLKWQTADRGAIDSPAAWLTTICTRRCLDMLRAARKCHGRARRRSLKYRKRRSRFLPRITPK